MNDLSRFNYRRESGKKAGRYSWYQSFGYTKLLGTYIFGQKNRTPQSYIISLEIGLEIP